MRTPLRKRRPGPDASTPAVAAISKEPADYDDHVERSRQAQRQADRWLIAGTVLMGMTLPGIIGLPIFLRGLVLLRRAGRAGLSVRPMIITLIAYMVCLDAALNCFGWALDTIASHAVLWQTMIMAWGNFFDAGYFWHYNQLPWVGGAGGPGEKAWEITCVLTVFAMRMAACIGLLRMKRWGHQWMIVTCWFGVVIWVGYVANMTIFADVRYAHTVFPVIGWWLYDIFYITPFLAIPYLHTVNREVFSD
ncbi:hypothetical protein [Actinomadura sp. NTSP31]|uniref:hypothetical protein n=1 Tax=Actinomadura sp. NTSP31 TaxID=1735447 RepID=UPI0035C243CE